MAKYILARFVLLIPVLIGVSVVTFSLIRLVPGDPVTVILGPDVRVRPEDMAAIRAKYGLDEPPPIQYARWMGHVVSGDLGTSFRSGRSLTQELALRLPVTVELTVLAAVLGLLPALLVLAFSLGLRWLPPIGYVEIERDPLGNLRTMLLPAISLGLPFAGIMMRITRSSVLEVLGHDHVRVARAKGLRAPDVLRRHVLPNAAIPIITVAGIQIARLLGGAVIIETIFGMPGIGRYVYEAISTRDYPVVQGVTLIVALAFVLVSLVVDVLYTLVDPRLRTAS